MKNIKAISKFAVKWIAGAAVAGALLLATPHQAQAQSFGVQVAVRPVAYGYFGPARYDGWHRRVYNGYQGWAPAYVPYRHYGWERGRYYAHYGWRVR
jgi:hypothetical protein